MAFCVLEAARIACMIPVARFTLLAWSRRVAAWSRRIAAFGASIVRGCSAICLKFSILERLALNGLDDRSVRLVGDGFHVDVRLEVNVQVFHQIVERRLLVILKLVQKLALERSVGWC